MTKKILIVDDQEEVLEILQLYIEGAFVDVETIVATGGYDAINILKNQNIHSIVCDYRMPDGDGSVVFNYNEKLSHIPFCWHTATFDTDILPNSNLFKKHIFHVPKPSSEEEICAILSSMLALSRDIGELRKVRISILKKVKSLECDLYLKLGETKKVLINSQNEIFPKEKLIDLEAKGVEFLYLKKDDFEKITSFFWGQFEETIKRAGSIEDIYFVVDDYVKGIHQAMSDLGINEAIFEVGLKCANVCLKRLNKDEAVKLILTGKIDRSNYISNHSLLTVQIAALFIEDKELLEFLAQAVIFHDLAISNERLAKIHEYDSEFDKLTPQEKDIVKNHGKKIIDLLQGKKFLPEIQDIVANHHRYLNDDSWINNCGIMEVVFFVSHEMAHYCCSKDLRDARNWLKSNENFFLRSTYKEFYQKAKNIFGV